MIVMFSSKGTRQILPTGLGKFCLAFRTSDTDSSFAFWNSDLLPTGWTTIDMVGLSLLHIRLTTSKLMGDFTLEIDKF